MPTHADFILMAHASEKVRAESVKAVRQSLFPALYRRGKFAVRLHRVMKTHFDVRFAVNDRLLSFYGSGAPSLNPRRAMPLSLTGDHKIQYLFDEYVIPADMPGAGPTMPIAHGTYEVVARPEEGLEANLLVQLAYGKAILVFDSAILPGLWELTGKDLAWKLRKLPDEYASATERLVLNRSSQSGKTLDEICATWGERRTESGQPSFDFGSASFGGTS